MPNHIKHGTSTLSSTTKDNQSIGVIGYADYGPTSSSGFYQGITPPNGGYTIYVDRVSGGPSIHVAYSDTQCIFFLKSFGATGSTISEVLAWATATPTVYIQSTELTSIVSYVTSGLVYSFDANNNSSYPGTGTTWTSVNGISGGTASLVNGPAYSASYGGGISLDGSNDYIALPTSGLNSNADFTVEIAFNMNSTSSGRNIMDGLSVAHLVIRAVNGLYYTSLVRGDQLELGNFGIGSSIIYDTNYLLTLSLNKSTTTFSLYLNGVFISTLNPGNQTFTTSSPVLAKHLSIYELTKEVFYSFKWYNRQLSSTEVLQNYNAVKDRLGLFVYSGLTLNLDAGNLASYPTSGTTWTDLSGNANNATLSGSPTFSSLNGGKLNFPYSNVYGTINDSASLQFGTGDFTISIWEYTGVVYDATNQRTLISKNYTGFEVMIYQATLRAYFGGASNSLIGTATLSANTWYNFVIVRSGTTITSYINKTQDAQITSSANISNAGTALIIGKRPSTTLYGDQTISNIQLYNRALSTSEITQSYDALKSRFGL